MCGPHVKVSLYRVNTSIGKRFVPHATQFIKSTPVLVLKE